MATVVLRGGRRESRAISTGATDWSGLWMTGAIPPHGWDQMAAAGVPVNAKTVLGISTVDRAIHVLVSAFDTMGPARPYREAFDKDGLVYKIYIPKTDRAYPSVLASPWGISPFGNNVPVPYENGMAKTITSLALWGKAWWLTTSYDFYGNPSALTILNPDWVHMTGTNQNPEVTYRVGGQSTTLDPKDLTLIERTAMPGTVALNPITALSGLWSIAIAASRFSQSWFASGAAPSYMLSSDNEIPPDEIKRLHVKLLTEHSGLNRANVPLITDRGLKPVVTQVDPEKSQMNQTSQFIRSEIAGYLGIPAHLVGEAGDSGGVWGKGISEQGISMILYTFGRYVSPLQAAFSNLIPRGQYAEIDPTPLLRANAADASKASLAYRTATVSTPNEERRTIGLPPIEGGDAIRDTAEQLAAAGNTTAARRARHTRRRNLYRRSRVTTATAYQRRQAPATKAERRAAVGSFDETTQLVSNALAGYLTVTDPLGGTNDPDFWVYDLGADWVVFNVYDDNYDSTLYQLAYSIGDDGLVAFSGSPAPVESSTTTEYVPAHRAAQTPCALVLRLRQDPRGQRDLPGLRWRRQRGGRAEVFEPAAPAADEA